MHRTFSKENVAGLAHQAVDRLRRLVSSGHEKYSGSQQDLLQLSKQIEEQWKKSREEVDAETTSTYCYSISREIQLQLSPTTGVPLPESAFVSLFEALRIVRRVGDAASADLIASANIIQLLTQYVMCPAIGKKARDAAATTLVDLVGCHSGLLSVWLAASMKYMCDDGVDAENLPKLTLCAYLAYLLVTSFHRWRATAPVPLEGGGERVVLLLLTACRLHESCGDGSPLLITTCTTYLGLIASLVRDCREGKEVLLQKYSKDFCFLWTGVASKLGSMKVVLSLPSASGSAAGWSADLSSISFWEWEMLELLIEVCSSDSFSRHRHALLNEVTEPAFSPTSTDSSVRSPAGLHSRSVSWANTTESPQQWDAFMTSGSLHMWKLASSLSRCLIAYDAVPVLEMCLLRIDINSSSAESIFRRIISTVALLCAASPQNSRRLAENSFFDCIIALVTAFQESVFASNIPIRLVTDAGTTTWKEDVSPMCSLNTNTARLTLGLLSSLAATYAPAELVRHLLSSVEKIMEQPHCSTDADIVESLLHVLACSFMPSTVLFFAGCGSITCRTAHLTSSWSGYTFSAWINPRCIWSEGCVLFSGSPLTLMLVANGQSCSLAIQETREGKAIMTAIAGSSFPAESWTHICFTHVMMRLTVFVNGRKLTHCPIAPFPKQSQVELCFGGDALHPGGFFGYLSDIKLFPDAATDETIAGLYAAGPEPHDGNEPVMLQVSHGDTQESISLKGSLTCEEVSIDRVIPLSSPNMLEVFRHYDVANWALGLLKKHKTQPNFVVTAPLCLRFIATSLRLTNSVEELDALLQNNFVERLSAEVLTWRDTFAEFASILLSAATPRGGGKALREHPSTQEVLTMLLQRLRVCGTAERVGDASIVADCLSLSCILRELSECLILPPNLELFRLVPDRFGAVLAMSLDLPQDCIESMVILIEKLFKGPEQLEETLRFLLLPQTSDTADVVKAEILRMLFDVARADTAMCERIDECFDGHGCRFIIMLVNGKNHSSESIRVYALRLLSLMLHVDRRIHRNFFSHLQGFDLLSLAITDPTSSVPIGLPTMDCLFEISFDNYRPAEIDAAMESRLSTTVKTTRNGAKHRDPNPMSATTTQGHLPGLISHRLKLIHREYSFEMIHDFATACDRLQLDSGYNTRSLRSKLVVPRALQTVFATLGALIASIGESGAGSRPPTVVVAAWGPGESSEAASAPLSVASPTADRAERNPTEIMLVRKVLDYLEKIAGEPKSADALKGINWLEWLWTAVGKVLTMRGSPRTAEATEDLHYSRKFSSGVLKKTRSIIQKLAVLDIRRHDAASTVSFITQPGQPEELVQLVVEEIARYFSKGYQRDLDSAEAVRAIRNLNRLFLCVEVILDPLPPPLCIDIVTAISCIAVSNNSQVRMMMKNTCRLFDIRDRLAVKLLVTITNFADLGFRLHQLLAAHSYELNIIIILLDRMTTAVNNRNEEEVEVLVRLIRHVTALEQSQRAAMYDCLGTDGKSMADLLASWQEDHSDPSAEMSDTADDSDSTVDGGKPLPPAGFSDPLHSSSAGGLHSLQVIEWGREDPERWSAVVARVRQECAKLQAEFELKHKNVTVVETPTKVKISKTAIPATESASALLQSLKAQVEAELQQSGQ